MRKAACLLMLLAGCGGAVGPEATAGRATVGEAFARCRQWGLSDAETDVALIGIDSDRDIGFTRSEELQMVISVCNDFPFGAQFGAACLVCYVSLVDIVYE